MIQRIQSIFLLASLFFLGSMFFVPIAEVVSETGRILIFNLSGFYQTIAGVTILSSRLSSLMIFGVLICALNFIVIFMYRRRILQSRLCVCNILLLFVLMIVILFSLYFVQGCHSVSYRLASVFPVISVIFHYLAFRGIRKDELMVQASNRLR